VTGLGESSFQGDDQHKHCSVTFWVRYYRSGQQASHGDILLSARLAPARLIGNERVADSEAGFVRKFLCYFTNQIYFDALCRGLNALAEIAICPWKLPAASHSVVTSQSDCANTLHTNANEGDQQTFPAPQIFNLHQSTAKHVTETISHSHVESSDIANLRTYLDKGAVPSLLS
jgi:hypothetical protein